MSSLYKIIVALISGAILAFTYTIIHAENMAAIKFKLGTNIVETAKQSGVPEFSVRDVNGLISYDLTEIPQDIPAVYDIQNNRVSFAPLFAFTMYADRSNKNDLAVDHVTLQFETASIKDHVAGQQFVARLISQMQGSNWMRYVSDRCPAVTGRSSLMDKDGLLKPLPGCALDPTYQIPARDWLQVIESGPIFQWRAANVLASLEISSRENSGEITYTIFMQFDDFEIKRKHEASNLLRDLSEGDKNGWKSTEKNNQNRRKRADLIKDLESNALLRGDSIVQRN